jgi:sugar-specific transcriptional regulator TrmB
MCEYEFGKQAKTTNFLLFLEPKFRFISWCRCESLSLERVIKILENFGFSKADAEVYIYLAKKGPRRETDLSKALKLTAKKLDSILKNLQSKGLLTATIQQSKFFSALSFEIVLDQLAKSNIQRASAITENKEKFLARWQSSIQKEDN